MKFHTGEAVPGREGNAGQLLIFDLDGTLIDSRKDLATSVNLMRRHYGLDPLPMDRIVGFIGDGVRSLVERSLAGTGIGVDEAIAVQRPLYRAHLNDETTLYEGVAGGLQRLHAAGHALAVATNKPVDATEMILVNLGIRKLFACVYGGGAGFALKPDPAMVFDAMKRTGVPAADTWLVGDNHTDIEAARRAGVKSIYAAWGFGERNALSADRDARSFAEITAMFSPQ